MALKRTEVNSNIRYNENLVNSYNRTINNICSQLDELYDLRNRVSNLQNSFGERQSERKSRLARVSAAHYDVNMINAYFSGMSSLLNGVEYHNAYNGLSTEIEAINAEIRRQEESRSYYENQRSYRQNRVQYWQRQMRYAKN